VKIVSTGSQSHERTEGVKMRRKKVVAASVAAVLALAAGTTALAAPRGGPLGLFGDDGDRRAEQAEALGKKLGVDPARVDRAMQEVHQERHEARQDEMAKALAARLNVSQADAERALERAFAAKRAEFERAPEPGAGPDRGEHRGGLAKAIAVELDKTPAEVKKALTAIRRERFEVRLAEAVKEGRITQKQADEIRKQMKSGDGPGFGPPHGGPMHGRGGGPGGFGGPGGPPQGGF